MVLALALAVEAALGCDARLDDLTSESVLASPTGAQWFRIRAVPGLSRVITRIDLEYGPGTLTVATMMAGASDVWSVSVVLPACAEAVPYRYRVLTTSTAGDSPRSELFPETGFYARRVGAQPASCHVTPLSDHSAFDASSLEDLIDARPGDGFCSTEIDPASPAAKCTLRAAVMEANAHPGWDTIRLRPLQRYTLTRVGSEPAGTVDARVGDLDVTDDIVIVSATVGGSACGAALEDIVDLSPPSPTLPLASLPTPSYVARVDAAAVERAFEVTPATAGGRLPEVHLGCLHVLGGVLLSSPTGGRMEGAGIANRGVLELRQVAITSGRFPGGLVNSVGAGVANFGVLRVFDSALVGNQGETGGAFFGGTSGGGLYNAPGASAEITRSLVGFNIAARAPEICNDGTLLVSNSTIHAAFRGGDLARRGAIANSGKLTIEWSTLETMSDLLFDNVGSLDAVNSVLMGPLGQPLCYAGVVNGAGNWVTSGDCIDTSPSASNHVVPFVTGVLPEWVRPRAGRLGFAPAIELAAADGSPVDHGYLFGCPFVDQHGRARPYTNTAQCDPGAIEAHP